MRIAEQISQVLNVTSGNAVYSPALDISHCLVIAAESVYTTTGSGSVALQVSLDGINFTDVVNTPVSITTSGSTFWQPTYWLGAKYIRVRLTSISGAISSVYSIVAKGG